MKLLSDPSDVDGSPPLPMHVVNPTTGAFTSSPQLSKTERDNFTFSSVSNVSRLRSASVMAESAKNDAAAPKEKAKLTHTNSDMSLRK